VGWPKSGILLLEQDIGRPLDAHGRPNGFGKENRRLRRGLHVGPRQLPLRASNDNDDASDVKVVILQGSRVMRQWPSEKTYFASAT
jgi:hypothetical protein